MVSRILTVKLISSSFHSITKRFLCITLLAVRSVHRESVCERLGMSDWFGITVSKIADNYGGYAAVFVKVE